ncbi:MAG: SPOR domain-containing protein [candidate division Zixibacteria bacterium]|nr:SPOR domain-containing protein [candidate division Zixibacteria bacterium]
MKKHVTTYSLIACVLTLILSSGCQQSKRAIGEESTTGEESVTAQERFDPLDLPIDQKVVPKEHPHSGAISGKVVFVETDTTAGDESSDSLSIVDVPDQIDSVYNQAYRIQLLTTKVFGESRKAREVAEEIFDRPVVVDYEVPYFKVRAGNFADRDEAEEYALRAKAAGYTNAWVVMVSLNVKKTTPLYEDDLPFIELEDSIFYDKDIQSDDESSDPQG